MKSMAKFDILAIKFPGYPLKLDVMAVPTVIPPVVGDVTGI